MFCTAEINTCFTKSNATRGKYPIGVTKVKNRFKATISKNNNPVHLGYFNTPEEAFEAYKETKEDYIRELANKHRGQITEACYQALINYKVEIDD